MSLHILKKAVLNCFILLGFIFFAVNSVDAFANENKNLTKTDVEKIIHDYISENPQFILDAVDKYQKQSVKNRQASALKKNKVPLLNDIDTPEIGKGTGDVTLVEFFDYNCGYCKRVVKVIQELVYADPNLRVLFKELPILGPSSTLAAKWALAANYQKKYFEFHQELMKNNKPINEKLMKKISKKLSLDVDKMKKDAESADVEAQITKNKELARTLDIGGTPAFIVGDTILPGIVLQSDLEKLIKQEREKNKKK